MANIITAYSTNDGPAHEFRFSDELGVQVGGVVAAVHGGLGTHKYTVTVPASFAAGFYSFAYFRTSNGRFRGAGEFMWDGTDIVMSDGGGLTAAEVTTAAEAAITNQGVATSVNVSAAETAILAAIALLPTVTQIETALLDDGDGTALREAFAATFEAALANEADGNATVAVFQGAVTAALNAFNAATTADVTNSETALTTLINGLNDISSADIAAALTLYDAVNQADLDAAVVAINSNTATTSGLTPTQLGILEFIRDVVEGDQNYTPTQSQILHKISKAVLVNKNVASTTTCSVSTQLTEV